MAYIHIGDATIRNSTIFDGMLVHTGNIFCKQILRLHSVKASLFQVIDFSWFGFHRLLLSLFSTTQLFTKLFFYVIFTYNILFQVDLLEYNAKHALFKVMPRYKVKSEGDVVCFN